MPRASDLLKQAAQKRDVAKQIRDTATTLSQDTLRERVIRQADQLEKEATVLETLARTNSRYPRT